MSSHICQPQRSTVCATKEGSDFLIDRLNVSRTWRVLSVKGAAPAGHRAQHSVALSRQSEQMTVAAFEI